MARASGPADEGVMTGEFTHRPSGVHYRVFENAGKIWLGFSRPGDPIVSGRRELLYYIGSGGRGRTYLYKTDGFLFEAPVNWYSQKQLWDTAPAYQDARQIPMNLPAMPECLSCHASGQAEPIAGTVNKYDGLPFQHGGITCGRCHTADTSHATAAKSSDAAAGKISAAARGTVNPVKLAPNRRDYICMQCHLEGSVAIQRPGRHLYDFKPGDDLLDYIRYFVKSDPNPKGIPALSQVEALAQSQCAIQSGSKMSCMRCHDPHYTPPAATRVEYYRGKCVACHSEPFAAKHHPETKDCIGCHMPFVASSLAHTQATDHRILKHAMAVPVSAPAQTTESQPQLKPFPDIPQTRNDARSFGLAWQSLAEGGQPGVLPIAHKYLSQAVSADDKDSAVLASLGYIEQQQGDLKKAAELYESALKANPNQLDALTNLGVLEANGGNLTRATALWKAAFEKAPYKSAIGLNLAIAYCKQQDFKSAQNITLRVLEFNPDLPVGKGLLSAVMHDPPECAPGR